jgi:cytochrome c biogenesis protein CcmG/thiol:disulfide interchange protein DsbE
VTKSNRPVATTSTSSAGGRGQNRTIWIVGAALVVAIASTKDNNAGKGGQAKGSAGTVVANGPNQYGTVEVTGSTLPEEPTSGADSALGLTAPSLSGANFAGDPVAITNDGKPKVVMFVAHWCPHCQAEVPRIQAWLDSNGVPADVALYSVPTATTSARTNYPPSDWLVKQNWTVPVLVDDKDGQASKAFGLTGFPYFVVVGADGKVVQRASGEITMASFEKLLEAARTGQPQTIS